MSAIGRIFIVLNLILAAAFLGWASNALDTAQDYKQKYTDAVSEHATTLADKEGEISGYTVQVNTLRDDQRKFIGERDSLKSERDSLKGQLDEAKRTSGQMQAQLAEIAATLGDYRDSIAQLTSDKDRAIERAHEAENERNDARQAAQEAELARRDAEEAQSEMSVRVADLEEQNGSLNRELSGAKAQIDAWVVKYNIAPDDMGAVPQIEAAVLEFRGDLSPGLVMLNVGESDGVKRGFKFHIYRGGQYKGQVRVEGVEGDYCSAIVLGTTDGRTIQQGDRATTIL